MIREVLKINYVQWKVSSILRCKWLRIVHHVSSNFLPVVSECVFHAVFIKSFNPSKRLLHGYKVRGWPSTTSAIKVPLLCAAQVYYYSPSFGVPTRYVLMWMWRRRKIGKTEENFGFIASSINVMTLPPPTRRVTFLVLHSGQHTRFSL